MTQEIHCEYFILHCLEENNVEAEAVAKITDIFKNLKERFSCLEENTLDFIISTKKPLEAIQDLQNIHDFVSIIIGTSHHQNAWYMGETATKILVNSTTNVVVVPPQVNVAFPNNISVLIENQEEANIEKLTAFNRYASQYSFFINFVFFAETKEFLEKDKKSLEKHQHFFDANISFSYIIQSKKDLMCFFKSIEETQCDAAVVVWDENSMFLMKYLCPTNVGFPCNPNIPVYFSKKRETIDKLDKIYTPFK